MLGIPAEQRFGWHPFPLQITFQGVQREREIEFDLRFKYKMKPLKTILKRKEEAICKNLANDPGALL